MLFPLQVQSPLPFQDRPSAPQQYRSPDLWSTHKLNNEQMVDELEKIIRHKIEERKSKSNTQDVA